MRRALAALTAAAVVVLSSVLLAPAADAVYVPGPPPAQDPSTEAELQVVGTRLPGSIEGAFDGIVVDPTGYPAARGTPIAQGTSLIQLQAVDGTGPVVDAYCVNLRTSTYVGTTYEAADWSTGGVANSAYISWILTRYFPETSDPGGRGVSETDKVRAVQAAIWFFSDGFVLTDTDFPARERTRTIVEAAIDAVRTGSVTPPTPPTLQITPGTASVPSDDAQAGPFTVASSAGATTPVVVEQIVDLDLFADAARSIPVREGAPVVDGQQLWVGDAGPGSSFTIGADYTVTAGTLYLANPDPARFQKIVLAQESVLPLRASAAVSVFDANAVTVTKSVTGARAGSQGEVVVDLSCVPALPAGTPARLTVAAGSPAGDYPLTVTGIPVGSRCSAAEIADGADADAVVTSSTITPASVIVPTRGQPPASIAVVNTYAAPTPPPPPPTPTPAPVPVPDPVPDPALPDTGTGDVLGAVWTGGMLLLAGAVLVVARRRRA